MADVTMKILHDINLKPFNSYKTGGSAKYFARPVTLDELIFALKFASERQLNYEIIGAGSNLLISDDGYDGLIILLDNFNRYIMRSGDKITAGAGMRLSDVINYSIDNSLSGLENLSGIPGLLGGGVKMNAGAFNVEFKDFTDTVEILDPKTYTIHQLSNADVGFSYRNSANIDAKIIISATINLVYNNKDKLIQIRSDILKKRKEKQPLDKPSCGSVFKRPAGRYAGELIESVGLKGYKYNGAMISDKHANFILNMDNASSSDIKYLIDLAIDTVFCKHGIKLLTEVRYIGTFH